MVGDDDADVLLLEGGNDRLDVLHGNGVHAGEGFVEQDEGGVDGDGPGDLGPAALAAGELVAEALAHLLEAELLDEGLAAFALILLRKTGHLQHAPDVVLDAQVSEYRGLLRQVSHPHLGAAVYRQVGELGDFAVVVFQKYSASVGLDEPDDHIETGGLSGAVRAQKPDDLPLIDLDGDVVYDRAGLVLLNQIFRVETHLDENFYKVMFFSEIFFIFTINLYQKLRRVRRQDYGTGKG